MNKLKEEFDSVIGETAVIEEKKEVEFWKSVEDCFIGMSSAYDNAPLNIYKLIREFINQNYISREQILNLECLKEEKIKYGRAGTLETNKYDQYEAFHLGEKAGRYHKIKEIKESINNLK